MMLATYIVAVSGCSLCSEFGLAITNTFFQLHDMHKTSWMHPRSKHWHLIEYVIVRRRDLNEVQITRAIRGAECSTDHRLIRSTLRLAVRPSARDQNGGCLFAAGLPTDIVDSKNIQTFSTRQPPHLGE